MPETRSMTSKMAKELETLTVEITNLKEQIEQSKEKELTEEVARLRKHIEQSKEPELRAEIECLKERMETSKEGELFAEIASLRKQLEQSKEQELRVEIEKLKVHIEESKDLDVQKDITEIRQILEHLKAEQHVIVNSKENIKSPTARLTLPALSHFSGGSGEDIIEWLQRFETTLSISKIDGGDKIDMLKVYVTGYARIVLERYLATREMKELSSAKEHAEIFNKVRDHLKREFQKYDPVRYYMQQLRSLQQGSDESVKEYSRRMQRMTPKRDLPSQKNFAPRHAHRTFSQPTPPSHAGTFQCNTCNGFGHMARECPSPYVNLEHGNQSFTCYECQGFGHYGRNCPSRRKRLNPAPSLPINSPTVRHAQSAAVSSTRHFFSRTQPTTQVNQITDNFQPPNSPSLGPT